MFSTRNLQMAVLWWTLLVVLAALLAVLMSSPAGGQEPGNRGHEPPTVAETWQQAVAAYRGGSPGEAAVLFKTALAANRNAAGEPVIRDAALDLWAVLAVHADGDLDAAVAGWQRAALPPESELWRSVALVSAHLAAGRLHEASAKLDAAWKLNRDHPVVCYFTGLDYLAEARGARDWYDAVGPPPVGSIAMIVYRPKVVPNSASMYRFAAMQQLAAAAKHADEVQWERPLVPEEWTVAPELRPNVGDLLAAVGAADFECDAVHRLGNLHLGRGNADAAEPYLDRATALGAATVDGYRDLGALYQSQGRHLAAARAQAKAAYGGVCVPSCQTLDRMFHAFWLPWVR